MHAFYALAVGDLTEADVGGSGGKFGIWSYLLDKGRGFGEAYHGETGEGRERKVIITAAAYCRADVSHALCRMHVMQRVIDLRDEISVPMCSPSVYLSYVLMFLSLVRIVIGLFLTF